MSFTRKRSFTNLCSSFLYHLAGAKLLNKWSVLWNHKLGWLSPLTFFSPRPWHSAFEIYVVLLNFHYGIHRWHSPNTRWLRLVSVISTTSTFIVDISTRREAWTRVLERVSISFMFGIQVLKKKRKGIHIDARSVHFIGVPEFQPALSRNPRRQICSHWLALH